MFAKIENGLITRYPVNFGEIRAEHPNVSIPDNANGIETLGYVRVTPTQPPIYNELTHRLVDSWPVYQGGICTQVWRVDPLPANVSQANVKQAITQDTQSRLDDFAKTRGYDGILSLCTYATSPTPQFSAEGQYGVAVRDATWAKLYEIMAEVEAGTRPMPTGFQDVVNDLPPLVWPN